MWVKTRDGYHNLTMCRSIRYGTAHASDPTHVPGTPAVEKCTAFVTLYYGMHRDGQNVYADNVTVVQIPACENAAERLQVEIKKLDAVLRGESELWDAVEVSPLPNKKPHY